MYIRYIVNLLKHLHILNRLSLGFPFYAVSLLNFPYKRFFVIIFKLEYCYLFYSFHPATFSVIKLGNWIPKFGLKTFLNHAIEWNRLLYSSMSLEWKCTYRFFSKPSITPKNSNTYLYEQRIFPPW